MGGISAPPFFQLVMSLTPVSHCLCHLVIHTFFSHSQGRGTVLGLKLDRMADSVSGQTVVDPKVCFPVFLHTLLLPPTPEGYVTEA